MHITELDITSNPLILRSRVVPFVVLVNFFPGNSNLHDIYETTEHKKMRIDDNPIPENYGAKGCMQLILCKALLFRKRLLAK
jgi:hypothetical protein